MRIRLLPLTLTLCSALLLVLILGACVSAAEPQADIKPEQAVAETPVAAAPQPAAPEQPAAAASTTAPESATPAPAEVVMAPSTETSPPTAAASPVATDPAQPATPAPNPAPDQAAVPPPTSTPAPAPASPAPVQPSRPAPATPAPTQPAPAQPAPAQPAAPAPAPRSDLKPGEIVYLDGAVVIHRQGRIIENLDFGDTVEPFDVIVTGPKSRADIDIYSGRPGGATIRLAENTAFYYDTKQLSEQERRTVLQLLSGSVAIKVDRLASSSFKVATDSSVLGVRGTTFIVDTVPDGTMLVSCAEGVVAVSAEGQREQLARPGTVVSANKEGAIATAPVAATGLSDYRNVWQSSAYLDFTAQAGNYIASYAGQIRLYSPRLNSAHSQLLRQSAILQQWRRAKAAGHQPRFTEWTNEKKTIAPLLFDALAALFMLERPFYRMLELQALHDGPQAIGRGALEGGQSSTAYFSGFRQESAALILQMADIREALLLFSWASADSPLGAFFSEKAASLGSGNLFLGEE